MAPEVKLETKAKETITYILHFFSEILQKFKFANPSDES